jgi:hypothetical protein
MLKIGLFAAAAVLTLVSASPPEQRAPGPGADSGAYAPCSRTVRDRCTQARERGSRASLGDESRALDPADNDDGHAVAPVAPVVAMAARAEYPRCSATLRDRCRQSGARDGQSRTRYAAKPSRRAYAMAGERG